MLTFTKDISDSKLIHVSNSFGTRVLTIDTRNDYIKIDSKTTLSIDEYNQIYHYLNPTAI